MGIRASPRDQNPQPCLSKKRRDNAGTPLSLFDYFTSPRTTEKNRTAEAAVATWALLENKFQ